MTRTLKILRSPWLLYLGLLSPIGVLALSIAQGNLEYLADPAKFTLEFFGEVAVILLIVVMAVTPIRRLFPKASLSKALAFRRRELGVSVFVYALLHFLIYIPYIGSFAAFADEFTKLFILSGIAALFLFLLLAVTSNNYSVKWLGSKRWKRLHLLVYPAVALVMYHQAAQEKTGYRETIAFFAPLVLLEIARLFIWLRKRNKRDVAPA